MTEENHPADAASPATRARVRALLTTLHRETARFSSPKAITSHPSARELVGMGREAVGPLFEAIGEASNGSPDAIDGAILSTCLAREILGDGPVIPYEERGRVRSVARIWLDWWMTGQTIIEHPEEEDA